MEEKKNLLSYSELVTMVSDPQQLEKRDKLNALLNHPPRAEWLKKHPTVSVKDAKGNRVAHRYLPIDKKKMLLIMVFGGYRQEIIEVKQLANSICAIVRVHFSDPVTGQWTYQDGCGAFALQLDSGSAATDFSNMKATAVEMGAPNAVSRAFSNAVENIGRLFGMNLEVWDALQFKGLYTNGTDVQAPPVGEREPEQEQPQIVDEITTPL